MQVVRELLTETPELAKDLLGLLQMLDDGEVAVIGGIENRRIRAKLKELFPLLGLVKVGRRSLDWCGSWKLTEMFDICALKLREPRGAFAKPRKAKSDTGSGESLMEVFRRMLAGESEEVGRFVLDHKRAHGEGVWLTSLTWCISIGVAWICCQCNGDFKGEFVSAARGKVYRGKACTSKPDQTGCTDRPGIATAIGETPR